MSEATQRSLSSNRKKRGTVRASITRLRSKLAELEAMTDKPAAIEQARRLTTRLDTLSAEFKVHHYAIVDLLEGEEDMAKEQEVLDTHDDEVEQLTTRMQKLVTSGESNLKTAMKRLRRLEKSLSSISDSIPFLEPDGDDVCLLQQHQERLTEFKKEHSDVHHSIIELDLDESSDIYVLLDRIEKDILDCALDVRKLLRSQAPATSTTDSKSVKLPKLEVPTFDGTVLNWSTFWEQFQISVHSRSDLADPEKLAYLRNAVKGGSAKNVIEGLSRSGQQYIEAIESLKSRFERPRLIHQAHVRKILEAPICKDGSGKELRRLHDCAQQHLRALKAMGQPPSGPFVTSILELKLDSNSMFEWQRHTQKSVDVPHYDDLLEFINLRAQASESTVSDSNKKSGRNGGNSVRKNHIASFAASTDTTNNCIVCKTDKHPLYTCSRFKSMNHDDKIAVLKSNNLCLNCLRSGHFVKGCKSLHKCRICQKPHHSLLHVEEKASPPNPPAEDSITPISSHVATRIQASVLLMTCYVQVEAPDGSLVRARALLDSASSASFVSERLTQGLSLPRSHQNAQIAGVAGLVKSSPLQSIASFNVVTSCPPGEKISLTAVVVPRVTCDLPLCPIPFSLKWSHISGLQLADPDFGVPSKIDLLLGAEVFASVVLHGRRSGPPGSPTAFETKFGWALTGNTNTSAVTSSIATYHVSVLTGDDLLRKFWELEEKTPTTLYAPEERAVIQHFQSHHRRSADGRFVVPLPRKLDANPLGESRSQAVRRFIGFERSIHSKGLFSDVKAVIDEYFEKGHAELVPSADLEKPPQSVYYLPIHVVVKESSTTSKVRAVFDASAKTSSGVSLNDTLLVGPTVHSSLVDVLLRFRQFRVALIADVSRMYRAVSLVESDRDFHRFLWRDSPACQLKDYRMTRITFGVSASSFIANMCVRQNALDFASQFPRATRAVEESFYVDDGLTGADSIEEAIELRAQLQNLFDKGGFLLRKWNSSEIAVLQHIDSELRDPGSTHTFSDPEKYVKTLGIEWNSKLDHFRLIIGDPPQQGKLTKRALTSDIARVFDVLGWIAPVTVKAKILLQRLWEENLEWDDPVPELLRQQWSQWRTELHLLSEVHIPRCYYPREVRIVFRQLHGFSDASELAYGGVVYLRSLDSTGNIHISIVMAKTKVAPLKRLTIPRLELCGAHLMARLLRHCQVVFNLSSEDIFAWTDSTIVLNWLASSPRRFRTYVGNRVASITELVAPSRWNHVEGSENPADCASRGLLPSELLSHNLWWKGPSWLQLGIHCWPKQSTLPQNQPSDEANEICSHATIVCSLPIMSIDRFSSFMRLTRVTAWVKRFLHNCQVKEQQNHSQGPLSVEEMNTSRCYWVSVAQKDCFLDEINAIISKKPLSRSSPLLSLTPFIDGAGLLRVGGRQQNAKLAYDSQHPLILHGKHPISKLIIHAEHLRLLHAGPLLIAASLGRHYHIVGGRKVIRSITRSCVICRRKSLRPQPPVMGQLPTERVTPDSVFSRVGVDYAGPVYIKHGYVRKPTVIKAYVSVFVSLSVKAVHIELVSDLTSEAFIACLRRFVSRRGRPSLIWSDHGSNFVGASNQLKELFSFLREQKTEEDVTDFCSNQDIVWDFIPERAPHFGGLWEAAVKSFKKHLTRVVGNVRLTFEELSTVLTQIESCLNSRPLSALPSDNDDGIEPLTPGHFLIGRPLEALPNPAFSYRSLTLLKRWHLCQALVRHFWQRWSREYLTSLQKVNKWRSPARNLTVGDVVLLCEDNTVPSQWPLARVKEIHPGKDGVVRVVTVQTTKGIYTRPVVKVVALLPCS